MNNSKEYKISLMERGFALFPVHGVKKISVMGKELFACTCGMVECASPGKHPAIAKGLKAATKDPHVFENLEAGRGEFLNLGVITGIISKILAIDEDGEIGRESLEAEQKIHGKLPKTLTSITGRGRHLFFKYPNKKVFNRTNVWKKVDVRGDGGYCVIPHSTHISGVKYQWEDENAPIADAPQWILDKVCAAQEAPRLNEAALNFNQDTEWKPDDVAGMLDYLDPDMGYTDWANIGMAVHEGGYSFDLWDSWSRRGTKYKGSHDTSAHWKSFKPDGGITMGTLVDMAKINGWKPENYIIEKVDYETHPARDWLIEIGAYKGACKKDIEKATLYPYTLGFDPLSLPAGVIGDSVRWICETSIKPQPVLALLNVLCALGAVFGRRYASPIDTRTNLYMCGIAGTARGKDASRKAIKNIMNAVGLENYLASDDIKSATGMLTTLSKKPACIMMIDEFGLVIDSISNDSAGFKQDISSMLLKLYTHSNSTYTAGDYADKKVDSTILKEPNLCIYGTTTLATYLLALKKISIASGNLNRFIVLPGDDDPQIKDEDITRGIPEYIIESWKALIPTGAGLTALNSQLIDPVIKEVAWGQHKEFIKELLHKEKQKVILGEERGIGDLWGRWREHIIKIAMIFAISRNQENPKLEKEDLFFAEKIVSASVNYVSTLAIDYMYENEFEQNKKAIFRTIRDAKKEGMTKTELARKNQKLKLKDINDILGSLIEEEVIDTVREAAGVKTRVRYVAL